MKTLLTELLVAVVTAVIPVLTAFLVAYIRKVKDKAVAATDSTRRQWYAQEIAEAVSAAVSATSQTYVDELKKAGEFTVEAQKEAARKALAACLAAISPQAREFVEQMYGDIAAYLGTRIEAEVRAQKAGWQLGV